MLLRLYYKYTMSFLLLFCASAIVEAQIRGKVTDDDTG